MYETESTRLGSKKNLYQSTETIQMNPDLQNTKYAIFRYKSTLQNLQKKDHKFVSQL